MILIYHNVLKRGCRISLRAKVNDSLISGLSIIDSILPVGRGQRQLILGDRYTGKTSIFLSFLITSNRFNYLGSQDGFGTKRLFALYIGMNQNLSKLSKLIDCLMIDWFSLILASHSSSSSLLSFMIPIIGISIAERLRDRSFDSCICFDDLSKHSKSYRQISLILGKIPSRDAFPADIFNIHSSLLERCGKLKYSIFGGSITGLPIIDTINSDITEYISTNVISITDGQFYTSKRLFLDSCRPAIDSGLSVSRIGSNAQCKFMKLYSYGIKNLLTNYRNSSLNIIFFHDHLLISPLETSLLLLLLLRMDYLFYSIIQIHRLLFILSLDLFIYYILFISKSLHSTLLTYLSSKYLAALINITCSTYTNHFTFYLSYLGMNYSNVIGYLLIQVFIFQFISGILLSCYFSPFYTIAFDSIYYIMIDVKFGWLIRWFHVIGSSLFMLFIIAHWIRGSWLRLKLIDNFYSLLIWFSGILLFICSMIEGFLGYIISWGQMSYWGINVMINILSTFWMFNIISISAVITELIYCSSNVIINRIFVVHFSLGFLIGNIIFIHIFFLHSFSSSNSLFNSNTSLIIPFFPLFYNDIFVTLIWCSFSFCYFLFSEPDYFGNSDNLIFANSISTPNHILPEWYFLIFYSFLRAFSNKNIGILIILAYFLLVFLINSLNIYADPAIALILSLYLLERLYDY